MAQSAEEMNALLAGMTLVRQISFVTDMDTGASSLMLRLAKDVATTRVLQLRADFVTGLKLGEFGGGVTQLSCLRVKDVRALQHDRVAFELEDLENGRLYLRCRELSVAG